MLHEWLGQWGEQIDPALLAGSDARKLIRYLASVNVAGLVDLVGARTRDGAELVIIDVETNRPQRPAVPISRRETVGIYFRDGGQPTVLALRADFPDTLHQNWMPEGFPASLCVDDRPWQEAKANYTPAELIHRIIRWFERAGRGELHDPAQPADPVFCGNAIDIIFPRSIFEGTSADSFEFVGFAHDPSNPVVIRVAKPEPQHARPPAFVFVVYTLEPTQMSRIRRAPANLGSLARTLNERGLDLVSDLRSRITAWGRAPGDKTGRFDARLGILIRMPVVAPDGRSVGSIDEVAFVTPAAVGELGVALGALEHSPLSTGPKYSVLLQPEAGTPSLLDLTPVQVARAHVEFDRARAAQLAGRPIGEVKSVVLVGAGSIGSLVAEPLVREGLGEQWTVIDGDLLLPHNQARHLLTTFNVGGPKAPQLAWRLKDLRSDVEVAAIVADVTNAGDQRENVTRALEEADLIIDASASIPVARYLNDRTGGARRASVFFNPAGTAVILLLEDSDRTVDLRSLEAAYYGEILRSQSLTGHLLESSGTIRYAGACRAVTNRIPASRAQMLAGIVSGGLADALGRREASASVWSTTDGNVTHHRISCGGVRGLGVLDWTVTVPDNLVEAVRKMRREGLPAETGGVLLGVVDLLKRRIDLVDAWPAPPGSVGTVTGFTRGTRGLKSAVEGAIAKTLDQIRYVGEWHSHPRKANTWPSDVDLEQIANLTELLAVDECPALMLIVGDDTVSLNIADGTDDEENL